MKISVNWMKQYGGQGLDEPIDGLVRRIGAQLGGVEHVEDIGTKYKGVVIAKIVSCDDHPNADRLHVCMIDDGGIAQNVTRDENGYVQVVCGAPNVREGLLVAWLPPGSTVPDSVGKDPFVLEARELRGVISNGMLASQKELALGDNHDGILEIDPTEWSPNQADIKPGADFATVFGLNDYIIEIENKMFTHRPDCFGQLGVAREIAGIYGQQFASPTWYSDAPVFPEGSGLEIEVVNEVPALVPRLMTLTMKGVTIKPSPLWLQCALISVGQKPVNNVVDVTNYIMQTTAQPTHAYDYDKIRDHKLVARQANPGEEITLLNHKAYKLDAADIVIADGQGAIGLAGIMGGGDSEVSAETTNILLECATFDMYTVRRSSMRHGVFTDALARFNKGQSPLQNDRVLHLLMRSIQDVAGGEAAGPIVDEMMVERRGSVHPPVQVTAEFINARLGFSLANDDMKTLLENVEFRVEHDSENLIITAPFWRTDIETPEDVVEEIGRLYGFDKLPQELPRRSITPAAKNPAIELKAGLRTVLHRHGANEVLTYSFVSDSLLTKTSQDASKAFKISNALSPDLQRYRLSLTPSLLEKVHQNIKSGQNEFALFEFGKAHIIGETDPLEPDVPKETNNVCLVYAAKKSGTSAPYYHAKRYLDQILTDYNAKLSVQLEPLKGADLYGNPWLEQMTAPYEPSRSAVLRDISGSDTDGLIWGVVGEFKLSVRRALKLPDATAGFEIDPLLLMRQANHQTYNRLSKFPKITQDVTLKVPVNVAYQALHDLVANELTKAKPASTLLRIDPMGIYQRPDDTDHKQITLRVNLTNYERTLTDAEVTGMIEALVLTAQDTLQAERI